MPLNANALITLAEAKEHLEIPPATVTKDALIEVFINAASTKIETYCDRRFNDEDYTHVFNGDGSGVILARQWPVNTVDRINIDRERLFTDPANDVDASDIAISDDLMQIIVENTQLVRGRRNIQVEYNAGYAAIPADLKLACCWFVEWFYDSQGRRDIGRTNVSKGDESVSYETGMPSRVKLMLEDYRRQEFAENSVQPNIY